MSTALHSGQTLLFIGDSITDCGRRQDNGRPLGLGYVRLLADLLIVREPEKRIRVHNAGIGGNTIADLKSRWVDDALSLRPDWLSVKIGINDLNRFLGGAADLGPEPFRKNYHALLAFTRERLPDVELLVISPFYISQESFPGAYRQTVLELIPAYIEAAQAAAAAHGARFLDLHALFQQHLAHRHPTAFAPEPVHPHATGHLLMAEAVYRALEA